MYKVKYTDSTGNNDSIQDYLTKKEAIEAIDYELDEVKEYFKREKLRLWRIGE